MVPDPRFFPPKGPFDLAKLASIGGAEIRRCDFPDREYSNVAPLGEANEDTVSFLDNRKYIGEYKVTKAGCCIVHYDLIDFAPKGTDILAATSPHLAYAYIATAFHPGWNRSYWPLKSEELIHNSALIGENTKLCFGSVVGPNAEIGANCLIGPNVFIGSGVKIGQGCRIATNVSIQYSIIGSDVVINSGAKIGEPGFGFAVSQSGAVSVPQVGRVIVGDRVEIGANTTVDRGGGPDTVIGSGTRIDNLVHIGHNVRIGEKCIIAGQVGFAGSTHVGNSVMMGGQAGISGHLKIGDGAKIGGRAGVMQNVEAGMAVAGLPAVPLKQFLRQSVTLSRLAKKKGK